MNRNLTAILVAIVALGSVVALVSFADESSGDSDTHSISEFVGDYWWYNSTTEKYEERASIKQNGSDYILEVKNLKESTTIRYFDTGDATSIISSDGRITFNLHQESSSGTAAGTVWFVDNRVATGSMYVEHNLVGDNSNHYYYREGEIQIVGQEFQPYTLDDAIERFSGEGSRPSLDNLTILLPTGTYTAEVDYKGGNLTIKAQDGADVNIATYFRINYKGSEECSVFIDNLNFSGSADNLSNNLVKFDKFSNVSVTECTFNEMTFVSYGGETITFTDNVMTGKHEKLGDQSFAVLVSASTIDLRNNVIDGYLRGVNMDSGSDVDIANISDNKISDLSHSEGEGTAFQIAGKVGGSVWNITDNDISNVKAALVIHDSTNGVPSTVKFNSNHIVETDEGILYKASDAGKIVEIPVDANNNFFAPDGVNGVRITVASEGEQADYLVDNEEYYLESSMDSTNEDVTSPSWDDDEDLPPFIPAQPADDDDTVTIVACAAAAAVAAILAVFLVIDRKG